MYYVWGGGCQVTWFGRADIKLSLLHFLPLLFSFPSVFAFTAWIYCFIAISASSSSSSSYTSLPSMDFEQTLCLT